MQPWISLLFGKFLDFLLICAIEDFMLGVFVFSKGQQYTTCLNVC